MVDQTVSSPMFPANQMSPEELRDVAMVQQVEWYLGRQNLIADFFLKRQMDGQLWVSLLTIINFPKMRRLNVTDEEEAHLAHLLSMRSQIIEVDSTNHFIRPIWAIRSTLLLKGLPNNIGAVAIQGFLESLADPTMPTWVNIYQDSREPIWNVVFNSFEGAAKALNKVNARPFNGTPVVAEVKEETRNSMIGDAAILLEGNIPVYTPPGTPSAFYASNPEMMQGAGGAQGQGMPSASALNAQGHQNPVGMGYGNMAQPMMPISIGVQGIPHQGHAPVNGPYGYMPNPAYNGTTYAGNGVPQHMMQRGYNGAPGGYYIPYGGGHGYDPAAHAHAMQQQQHRGQVQADPSNVNANGDGHAVSGIQHQLGNVQLQTSGNSSPVPGRSGPRSPGTPGGSGPSRQNNNRRSIPRQGGHPHHHPGPAVIMTPQDSMGMAPGASMNMGGIVPGTLRVTATGVPVDSKGVPMQFVGMAHTMPNARQPHVMMPGARLGNGAISGGMPGDRGMRGYNSGPGGKPHRNHQANGDSTSRGAGPSRGQNGISGDARGSGTGKKNKKTGRNNSRQAGAHGERHTPVNYDAKSADSKSEGAGSGNSAARDARRSSMEEKKKPEPNLSTMYFPPLPGASVDGNSAAGGVGATKDTPKATPIQSESESSVTVSPEHGHARGDVLVKDEVTGKDVSKAPVANGDADATVVTPSSDAHSNGSSGNSAGPNMIADDRLSTASSSGGSEQGGRENTGIANSGMTYAAILRKKAAANAALASPGLRNVTPTSSSPNVVRGSGSKPSSPSAESKSAALNNGEMTRRRSYVGATTPDTLKTSAHRPGVAGKANSGNEDLKNGQTDTAAKAGSPRSALVPDNRPLSVWANKPRSVCEPTSSSSVARTTAMGTKHVVSPSVTSAPQLPASVAAPALLDKGSEAKSKDASSVVLGAKGGDGDASVKSEGSAVTQPEANGAPFLTEKVSEDSVDGKVESSSANLVVKAKGAWASRKKWVATKESADVSGKLES